MMNEPGTLVAELLGNKQPSSAQSCGSSRLTRSRLHYAAGLGERYPRPLPAHSNRTRAAVNASVTLARLSRKGLLRLLLPRRI